MIFSEKIKGYGYQDSKTKRLVGRLPKKSVAIVMHQDIDMTAAEMLIKCDPKAIVNFRTSMSGLFIHNGVETLLNENIAVYDIDQAFISCSLDGEKLLIDKQMLFRDVAGVWQLVARLKRYNCFDVIQLKRKAAAQFPYQFKAFVENSISYGDRELLPFLDEVKKLPVLRQFRNRDVLIVARGAQYEKDLFVIKNMIKKRNVLTIGVDGGADGLLNIGIKPDYIIGDMDSVSEQALTCGAQLLVHTYRDGRAPGEIRLLKLKVPYEKITLVGTSEDAALVFSYCSGARRLYSVGTRMGMNEFLEKGRVGMGSSLLSRMKTGHALVDLKGIHTIASIEENKNEQHLSLIVPALIVFLVFRFTPRFDLFLSLILQWWNGG